jgi:DNA polymerase-1
VHTTYNQTVTATGRLSSTNPNLQNIPIRTELGKKIRQAFIPSKPEYMLLSADYSQIELRILAHITGEPNLIEAFKNNLDIHRATAAKVFGVPLNAVTEQQRSHSKAVNFGIAYGMSARKLAQTVGLSIDDAQKFIDSYFATYPGVRRYIDETIALAKKQGYVSTLLGRRRYFPEINSPKKQLAAMAERAAINMPMQGTSADFIKIAMIRIHDELHHQKLKSKMILQVHDELVFDGPETELYDLECLVKKTMSSVYPDLKVPLIVNVATGHTWLEAK